MSAITGYLLRLESCPKQTLGRFYLFHGPDRIFEACSLELPWCDNQRCVSCIPAGTYKVVSRWSDKYKSHWHIQDVPGRDWILIHHGNFYDEIKGCVLLGSAEAGHTDINADGLRDVVSSRRTMHRMNAALASHECTSFHLRVV